MAAFLKASTLRRNIGMTMTRQVVGAFVQLLVVVLIARSLGPEGNGQYAMAILVPTMLANFLSLGVGPATVYFVSRKEFPAGRAIAGNISLGILLSFIGVGLTLPALAGWGIALFPGVPIELLYLGLFAFPVLLLMGFMTTILQALEEFKAFNVVVLLPPFVSLGMVAVTLYVLDMGVYAAVTAYILGQLAGLVAVFWLLCYTRRNASGGLKHFKMFVVDRDYNNAVLKYGWKAHLSNIVTFINYRSDIFLVNFFLSPAVGGIYVIAVQLAEKLWIPSQALSTVLLPRMSGMSQDPEARFNIARKGFWGITVLTALLGAVSALALYWLIGPVFGDAYRGALLPFFWLLPGVVLWAGARVQANYLAALGKPEWNAYISVVVLIVNITGNIVLIPVYGVVGAAIATSVAYAIDAIGKFFFMKRSMKLSVTRTLKAEG